MGMSNMQVQQPMQQGSGKGFASNQATQPFQNMASNAQSYFDANPDVAQSFQQNNYGMNEQEFANTHFNKYGQAEGRAMPGQQPQVGQQPRMGQPNMYSNTIRPWDNASIQPQQSRNRGGKGKG